MLDSFDLLQTAASANDSDKAAIAAEVLAREPDNLAALELLALSEWRKGNFEKALEAAGKALALNPAEAAYAFIRGDCLQQLQRFPEAAAEFSRCCDRSTGSMQAEAAVNLREVSEMQESIAAELLRYNPQLASRYAAQPYEVLKELGFSFPSRQAQEAIAKVQIQWARPS